MFSDTHFHFSMVTGGDAQAGASVLGQMADRGCFFGMDIGTGCGDLAGRMKLASDSLALLDDSTRNKAAQFLHLSAGIWPDPDAIRNRAAQMNTLADAIAAACAEPAGAADECCADKVTARKLRGVAAVGECGLDHHWNPAGTDGRCERDFDAEMYRGERELFTMQLALAKRLGLPVIVHSRDACADTLACIGETDYDCGIIHCYSYGLEEARKFLERGWYISFSGSVTYTKKTKMDDMRALLRYVPADRILCETDAPYLAPVPKRGQPNTPLFVEHTYRFIADARGMSVESLCATVDENCRTLFSL